MPKGGEIAVVYVCRNICKDIWMGESPIQRDMTELVACSPRASYPFADMLAEEESKT